ncbi:hypothetical protein VB773_22300 [Haloarculaceae archaeon H-GB2-1]|nr:hypothetical protein [Haloarculaceae archaeon H-GB1-1]MEA5389514.1 hypothetical protein [Haloarculaceae archaeon H-GB11]MEA5410032.1 hypothetical protein [Haloarculaceae archaeon H-GB2-1]
MTHTNYDQNDPMVDPAVDHRLDSTISRQDADGWTVLFDRWNGDAWIRSTVTVNPVDVC